MADAIMAFQRRAGLLLAAASVLAGSLAANVASAREAMGGKATYAAPSKTVETDPNADIDELALDAQPAEASTTASTTAKAVRTEVKDDPFSTNSKDPLCLVIGGQAYQSKYRTTIPNMGQVRKVTCSDSDSSSPRNVCHVWPKTKRSFEAAGKALGVPASTLACVMKIESRMTSGRVSSEAAAGLTQFIPETARGFQNLMSRSSSYQKAWAKYRSEGGTDRRVSEFNARNIRSPRIEMADVQIFATAMYFRDILKGSEEYWRKSLGPPPEPNSQAMKRMMHYVLVSYNASPWTGNKFLRSGAAGYAHLPRETRNYITRFDACMSQASKY